MNPEESQRPQQPAPGDPLTFTASLIEGARKGDPEAGRALGEHIFPDALRLVDKVKCPPGTEPDEFAADGLMKLVRSLLQNSEFMAKVRNGKHLRGYLHTTVRREVVDAWRRYARRRRHGDVAAGDSGGDGGPTEAAAAAAAPDEPDVERMVALFEEEFVPGLDPEHLAILRMFQDGANFSVEEVAKKLGKDRRTAARYWAQLRQMISRFAATLGLEIPPGEMTKTPRARQKPGGEGVGDRDDSPRS